MKDEQENLLWNAFRYAEGNTPWEANWDTLTVQNTNELKTALTDSAYLPNGETLLEEVIIQNQYVLASSAHI